WPVTCSVPSAARVPVSVPAVRPTAAVAWPAARAGSSGDPAAVSRRPASTFGVTGPGTSAMVSCSRAAARSVTVPPAPPASAGIEIEKMPRSARSFRYVFWAGPAGFSSRRRTAATGPACLAQSRIDACMASWSGVMAIGTALALLTRRRMRGWNELEHVSLACGQVAGRLGRARLSPARLAHEQEDPGDQGHRAGDAGRHRDDRVEQLQFGAAAGVESDDRLHGVR